MGGRADVVLSDMAANTTGHRKTDQLRILGLVEGAAAFAADVLNPGGTFVAKVFQSGADAELLAQFKRDFASVKPRQAGLEPAGFLRALCAGDGISGAVESASLRPNRHCEERQRRAIQPSSFRDGPKDQTRIAQIPGSMLRIAPE